jgi:hypothetical protein
VGGRHGHRPGRRRQPGSAPTKGDKLAKALQRKFDMPGWKGLISKEATFHGVRYRFQLIWRYDDAGGRQPLHARPLRRQAHLEVRRRPARPRRPHPDERPDPAAMMGVDDLIPRPPLAAPPTARGRIVKPPPPPATPLTVVLVNYSQTWEFEVPGSNWTRNGALPVARGRCLVHFDDDGDAWVSIYGPPDA